MDIQPMTAAHLPQLAALEAACFSLPWSQAGLEEELHNSAAVFLVATEQQQVLGYVGMFCVLDEGFITNVAVLPAARRQGVARRLLQTLAENSAARGLCRLSLEVRCSNTPAIALYESLGWKRDGVRPAFYSHPTEDAFIYSYSVE